MQAVHFVAIGGQGMSGIARILLSRGYRVSGSDTKESNLTGRLRELGAIVHIGHSAENVESPDIVVVSSAIHPDNPELVEARRRGIPVVHRMDMLLQAVQGKRLVAVAGAHGKTTTTSMTAWILRSAGLDPTYLVGGEFGPEGNAHAGMGEHAVFETDESDGSFLKVHADVALATNIDNDHLDYWGSMDALEEAFYRFLDGVGRGGTQIACSDDPRLRRWASTRPAARTYAMTCDAVWEARDARPEGWGSCAGVFRDGREAASLRLHVPGAHNVQNAVGAIAAGSACGVEVSEAARYLSAYPGVKRRLERIGEFGGVLVLDDFAHHPSEITASISAVGEALPGRRVLLVFQPHRYSRTRLLKDDFGKALAAAHAVFVAGIYAGPGEAVEEGVSAAYVSDAVKAQGHKSVALCDCMYEAAAAAAREAREGDVIITMGAGDIWKTRALIEKTLRGRRQ